MGLVADEIVVADKNFSSPPQLKDGVQLGQHLIGAFITGLAAVKVDDIAELAIERTAPGRLDAQDDVIVQIKQVEAGHRREGHLRSAVRLDDAVGLTGPVRRQPER